MRIFLSFFIASFITLSLTNCSNSNDPTDQKSTSDVASYFPLDIGNEWYYEGYLDGSFRQYSIRIVNDTIINSQKYYVGIHSLSPGVFYVRSDNKGVYYYYPDSLKEKKSMVFGKIGDSYEIYRSDNSILFRDLLTVVDVNVSKEIEGKVYKNCIVISKKTDMKFFGDTWSNAGSVEDIYSENIGLVQSMLTSSGGKTGRIYLKSYISK